jgi:hypothetical protein
VELPREPSRPSRLGLAGIAFWSASIAAAITVVVLLLQR